MKSKFNVVIEREIEHVEHRLEGLSTRYGTSVERERAKLVREWKGLRAALVAYQRAKN